MNENENQNAEAQQSFLEPAAPAVPGGAASDAAATLQPGPGPQGFESAPAQPMAGFAPNDEHAAYAGAYQPGYASDGAYAQPNGAYAPQGAPYAQPNGAYAPQGAPYAQPNGAYAPQGAPYAQPNGAYAPQGAPYAQPNMAYGQPYQNGVAQPFGMQADKSTAIRTDIKRGLKRFFKKFGKMLGSFITVVIIMSVVGAVTPLSMGFAISVASKVFHVCFDLTLFFEAVHFAIFLYKKYGSGEIPLYVEYDAKDKK